MKEGNRTKGPKTRDRSTSTSSQPQRFQLGPKNKSVTVVGIGLGVAAAVPIGFGIAAGISYEDVLKKLRSFRQAITDFFRRDPNSLRGVLR